MAMFFRVFGLVLLPALLTSCGESSPLEYLDQDAVMLAFGDSLTRGVGAGEGESYPEVLQRLSGRRVVNAGVSGEVSAQGRERLPALLDELKPQLLILCHGGNDILRRLPKEQAVENLRAMIEAARERDIDVVLIGVPELSLLLPDSEPYYERLAEEFSLPFDGDTLPKLESQREYKADPIHLNGSGYRLLAEAVYELLKEHGAL
jgi:lysophospholipase L1-like esterase